VGRVRSVDRISLDDYSHSKEKEKTECMSAESKNHMPPPKKSFLPLFFCPFSYSSQNTPADIPPGGLFLNMFIAACKMHDTIYYIYTNISIEHVYGFLLLRSYSTAKWPQKQPKRVKEGLLAGFL
jgi:hypothetical protein